MRGAYTEARRRATGLSPLFAAGELRYHGRMYSCHFCGTAVDDPRLVYRETACAGCRRDLKVCLNCRFYSPGAHWDCSETIDELVKDKDRGTFCTFFSFRQGDSKKGGESRPAQQGSQARKKLDALFGNDT